MQLRWVNGIKILISGGGRCNFINLWIEPDAYLSNNPHFHKSALARYTQWDFIKLMDKHNLSWNEKTQGQLFCEQKSGAILQMLLDECAQVGVDFVFNASVTSLEFSTKYTLKTSQSGYQANTLVVATGGTSIPKMGATDFGLQVAKQFNINATNWLITQQQIRGRETLKTVLSTHFPERFAQRLANALLPNSLENKPLGQINKSELSLFGRVLNNWQLYPNATEGLRVAEVCLGGVDTNELSSKTMQVKQQIQSILYW